VKFQDIIGSVTLPSDNGESLLYALQQGLITGASDGSYCETSDVGTHTFILSDTTYDINLLTGSAYSPCSDRLSSSQAKHYNGHHI
jgi:hypothetical protein